MLALRKAVIRHNPKAGLLIHGDKRVRYANSDFQLIGKVWL